MFKHAILVTILTISVVSSETVFAQSEEIDPATVSPEMYKVILDNQFVRVVDYQIPVGSKDNWHTHPAKASYVVKGGKLKITTDTDESFTVNEETGTASWFGAVGLHTAENVGDTPVHIVFVEIKALESGRDNASKYKRD
jgi:beta-alanine degradation protein BauB